MPAVPPVHECQSFAATMLLDARVDEQLVIERLSHATVAMEVATVHMA